MRYSVLFLGFLAVGCSKSMGTVAKEVPVMVPQGFEKYDKPEFGLTVVAPPNWRLNRPGVPKNMDEVATTLSAIGSGSANLGSGEFKQRNEVSEMDEEEQKKHKKILVLFDNGVKPTIGEEMTQMQVKQIESGMSPEEMKKKAKRDTNSDAVLSDVNLPIGNALMARSTSKSRGGDDIVEIHYYIPNGPETWHFRWVCVNSPQALDQVAPQVMSLVRVKPKKG